jgi:hypothetical protein
MQKLRIAFGNRLAAYLRRGLGQEPGMKTDELSAEAKKVLADFKEEYGRIADAVALTPTKKWRKLLENHEGLIQSPYDIAMARHYVSIERDETYLMGSVGFLVEEFPIARWLLHDGPDGSVGVRGCGPLMAAVIIGELDPRLARHESSFWRYAGLDVVAAYERPNLCGSRELSEGGLLVRGAGAGLGQADDGGDQLYYVAATSGHPTALRATLAAPGAGVAGLMLRATEEQYLGRGDGRVLPAQAPCYALCVDADGTLSVQFRRTSEGSLQRTDLGSVAFPLRMEVTCDGGLCEATVGGPDGAMSPLPAARQRVPFGPELFCGPVVWGGEALRAQATFEDLTLEPEGEDVLTLRDPGWSGADLGDIAGYKWGEGRSRRREHLVKRLYTSRRGTQEERDSLTFNPFLKTKLVGVLAPSFMKLGGHYKQQYDMYKHRLESHPRYGLAAEAEGHREARKGHRDEMSRRYIIKLFLADLWKVWRELEGLPTSPFYAQAKLGYPAHHVPFREYWPPKLAGEAQVEEAS